MDFGIIALIAAAVLFAGVKGKQKTAEQLEFFPKSLALSKDKKTLWLIVEVLNPTKRPLVIDFLFLTIKVGTVKVGSIERTTPFTIQKTGRTAVKLPVRISPVGLGKIIAMVIQGRKIIFRVFGKGESNGIPFPVDEVIPLEL